MLYYFSKTKKYKVLLATPKSILFADEETAFAENK
jgi:hypothetical protein